MVEINVKEFQNPVFFEKNTSVRIERNFGNYSYYLFFAKQKRDLNYSDMSIPTLRYNILSKDKLDYSTNNVGKFWEGKNLTC